MNPSKDMAWPSNFCQGLGIDLVQAAKNELTFLERVAGYPNLCSGPIVREAIRRYELFWLPLASINLDFDSQAPLDIAWVWHAHLLAPYYYEQDCLNIVNKVLDHSPLDVSSQRQTEVPIVANCDLWRDLYSEEPFEIDLAKPPAVVVNYQSKIQYNLEEACARQFKFFYQVSLPHYKDDLFLKKAVERYENHLRIKRSHPDVVMVPSYDVELMWHAHQLHPVNYRQTTTELLGKPLHQDDTETGRKPGSMLYEPELTTRSAGVWEAEGLQFVKSGAAYRGDPPDPMPTRPKFLYAPLALSEYPCEIQGIEALDLERMIYPEQGLGKQNLIVRLEDSWGKKYFSQSFKGSKKASNPRPWTFIFENGKERNIYVCLYKKKIFGEELIAFKKELDLRPQFESISFIDEAVGSRKRFTVDVSLRLYTRIKSLWTVKVTIQVEIEYPTIVKYNFEVQPSKMFRQSDHPSLILSSPLLMLSSSELAKPDVPCDSSTHSVIDSRGNKTFHCRVVHSLTALLSAAEVIDESDQVVATTHIISPSTLPRMDDVEDHKNSIVLNQEEGERAMLIRGNQDWAVCIGHWQKDSKAAAMSKPKEQYFVGIKVYMLSGERGWCSVRKSSGGVFLIKVDSDTTVRIDLGSNKIEISPQAQDIPEVLALAFSLSILHLLFIPYLSYDKCRPASQTSTCASIPSSFHSAGYDSKNVPTNAYLGVGNKEATAATVTYGCSDFNENFFWNECSKNPRVTRLVQTLAALGERDAGGGYLRGLETGGGVGYRERRGYRGGRKTGGGGGYRERLGSGGSESDHGCDRRESNGGGSRWEGLERRDSRGSEGGRGCDRRESYGGGGGWGYSGGGGFGGGFGGGGSCGGGCDGGYED